MGSAVSSPNTSATGGSPLSSRYPIAVLATPQREPGLGHPFEPGLAPVDGPDADHGQAVMGQRAVMEPIVESLETKARGVDGFQHAAFSWRAAQARATLDFLDAVEALGDEPGDTVR